MLCCCISYLFGSLYFVFVCYTECVQEENKVWRYHMNGYRESFSLKGNAISQCTLLAAAAWWNWSLGISSEWSSGDAPRWNKWDVDLFSLCLPICKSSWPSQHLQKLKLNRLKRNFLLIATWHICKQRNILIFEGRRPTVRDWISKFIDDARLQAHRIRNRFFLAG